MNKETRTFVFYFILLIIFALSAGNDVVEMIKGQFNASFWNVLIFILMVFGVIYSSHKVNKTID